MSTKAAARPEQIGHPVGESQNAEESRKHPLMLDGWTNEDDPEWSNVSTYGIADVTRAATSIQTIARLLHNSLGEPSSCGAQPLGRDVELSLADALLCLGDFIFERTNDMRDHAAMSHKFDRAREAQNV
jgi:hypothetical protein